jgi:hypothetical protein
MLLRIARALDIADLSDLTDDGHAVPVQAFVGEGHSGLAAVQTALTAYPFTAPATVPNVEYLELRLDQVQWCTLRQCRLHRVGGVSSA